MVSVDTNILVRILTIDDPKQAKSAEEFISRGAWVSHLVLAETIWVLITAYGRNREQTAKTVELLLSHERLTIEQPDVVSDALNNFSFHRSVSFTDCLILESARKAGHIPLGTFDRGLAKLDGTKKL